VQALTSASPGTIVPAMNVVKATRHFEDWLSRRTRILKKPLELKHAAMKSDAFRFLRATYYRWAQVWPEICPELARAPQLLAVGDLHVENFGTWRDIEGRLVWGVNDFDEAHSLSYANDLVRLAVSAHLAAEAGHLPLDRKDICDAILDGYRTSLRQGGKPFILGENHVWLRNIAEGELRDPVVFWRKMDALPTLKEEAPASAIEAIEHLMPVTDLHYRLAHRVAGLGSLGHARYVAIADWCGARIAREAKALAPSACSWAEDEKGPAEILYQAIISHAVRCPDPFVQLRGRWIVRRLSPHCSRIELKQIEAQGVEMRLLHAMGWETANIHLGTRSAAKAILRHLQKQKGRWLHQASEDMLSSVQQDWKAWKRAATTDR
jgi:Uncharacterized protein conserved in bacteria (DUF2252)